MSVFAPIKYELIHFMNKLGNYDTSVELTLRTNRVFLFRTYQVLEVILNSQLNFKTHIQHIEVKVMTSLEELAVIAGFT